MANTAQEIALRRMIQNRPEQQVPQQQMQPQQVQQVPQQRMQPQYVPPGTVLRGRAMEHSLAERLLQEQRMREEAEFAARQPRAWNQMAGVTDEL